MSEAGRAAGRPGRYFAAALRFARTTGHTGIDVSAGWTKRAAKERGEYHVRTVSVFLGGEPDAGTHPGGGAEGGCAGAAG